MDVVVLEVCANLNDSMVLRTGFQADEHQSTPHNLIQGGSKEQAGIKEVRGLVRA